MASCHWPSMFNDRIEAFAGAGNIRRTSRVNQLVGREPPVLVLQHGGAHHEVLGVGGARLRCRCALLRRISATAANLHSFMQLRASPFSLRP